jgi:hypothetical protein
VEIRLHAFIISALGEGEWLASFYDFLTMEKVSTVTIGQEENWVEELQNYHNIITTITIIVPTENTASHKRS